MKIPNNKIILDLCGGTGSWSKPYKNAGYDVRLITLPENDVRTFVPPDNVYGILAAPPCTEFSLAKGSKPRDFASGMEIVKACLAIIWNCAEAQSLKFWAMENPVGLLRRFIGKAPYKFEQWQFGDNGIKPTELWGYFNLPAKSVLKKPESQYLKKVQSENGINRKAKRAITPAGFAKAFFEKNK